MKTLVAAFAFSVCLFAADFWTSKPYTEWTEKDTQKMIENSPWAKTVSIVIGGGMSVPKSGGRGSMGEAAGSLNDDNFSGPGGGMGGAGGGRRQRGGGTPDEGGAVQSVNVIVRWRSALPVKQALVKMKYGAEVKTSEEAKKILENEEKFYIIAISGVGRGVVRGDGDTIKKQLIGATTLSAKGKDEIKPTDIQVGREGKGFEFYFIFPKTTEFALDDKEVEFSTRFEAMSIKQKFRLKDMMYNGKLAL